MSSQNLDVEILSKLSSLNLNQKNEVLGYLENLPKLTHSTKIHRSRALKQIRKAIQNQ